MDKKTMLMQLIQHYEDGNKSRFAKRLGLTPQGVSTWLSRGTIDYELIYAKCEHLNAEWLLTGRGSMLRKDIPTPSEPVSAPSDAMAMRLMDKLDQKDAENKQLQSELLAAKEELATVKVKLSQYDCINPPKKRKVRQLEAGDLDGKGHAENVSIEKHSSPSAKSVTSATAQ